MKQINILFFFFLLFVSIAVAKITMYGGDSYIYHLDKCMDYEINISDALLTEWAVYNCTESSAGYFKDCKCNDDFNITMTPIINSVGDFNITIEWWYNYTTEESGGHGSVHINTARSGDILKKVPSIYKYKVTEFKPVNKTIPVTTQQIVTTIPITEQITVPTTEAPQITQAQIVEQPIVKCGWWCRFKAWLRKILGI